MMCRELKIRLVSAPLLKKLKKSVLKSRIYIIPLIALSVLVSSYQGKVISLKDTGEEMHQDIFSSQIKKYFKTQESKQINETDLQKTISLIYAFYHTNHYYPKWTINYSLNKNATDYITFLSQTHYYGLDPKEYNYKTIQELQNELYSEKNYLKLIQLRIETEIVLTHSCFRLLRALHKGVLYEHSSTYVPDSLDNRRLVYFLSSNLRKNDLVNSILKVQPKSIQYIRLQKALEKFLKSVEMDHLIAELPDVNKEPLKAQNIVKQILLSLSYTDSIKNERDYIIALKKFQKFHSLVQNGKLDKKTCSALTMSFNERYKKIAINLERLRQEEWINDIYILVNIPAFNLRIFENNKEIAQYKTIIGKPKSPTPIFSGKIEKIVTNPSWIVPKSISSKELLYKAKTDTTYLTRNKYVIFDENNNRVDPTEVNWQELNSSNFNYRLIQLSSAGNALGKIKFLFPNRYSVYIHDTPVKKLFKYNYRAYSHGCVRLENPHFLAEYIINKQQIPNWDKQLKRNLSKGIQEIFELSKPIEIHLRYFTCEADDEGQIYFYEDIYNLDKEIMEKLNS